MDADGVRDLMREQIAHHGSMKAWAKRIGTSLTWVRDVLECGKEPSAAILRPLGLRRVVTYEIDGTTRAASPDPTSAGGGPVAASPVATGQSQP